jgi:ABC-type molybdate transport system permease subunit
MISPHLAYVITMVFLVTAYITIGLVLIRKDRRFVRTIDDCVNTIPVLCYVVLVVTIAFWPAKNIIGAFVWNIKQYMENA